MYECMFICMYQGLPICFLATTLILGYLVTIGGMMSTDCDIEVAVNFADNKDIESVGRSVDEWSRKMKIEDRSLSKEHLSESDPLNANNSLQEKLPDTMLASTWRLST